MVLPEFTLKSSLFEDFIPFDSFHRYPGPGNIRNANAKQLSLHRLVQILRDGMEEKVQRQWAKRTVFVVHAAFPGVEFRTWDRCRMCLPHAFACASLIEQFHLKQLETVELLNRAGWYLREQAAYVQQESVI